VVVFDDVHVVFDDVRVAFTMFTLYLMTIRYLFRIPPFPRAVRATGLSKPFSKPASNLHLIFAYGHSADRRDPVE